MANTNFIDINGTRYLADSVERIARLVHFYRSEPQIVREKILTPEIFFSIFVKENNFEADELYKALPDEFKEPFIDALLSSPSPSLLVHCSGLFSGLCSHRQEDFDARMKTITESVAQQIDIDHTTIQQLKRQLLLQKQQLGGNADNTTNNNYQRSVEEAYDFALLITESVERFVQQKMRGANSPNFDYRALSEIRFARMLVEASVQIADKFKGAMDNSTSDMFFCPTGDFIRRMIKLARKRLLKAHRPTDAGKTLHELTPDENYAPITFSMYPHFQHHTPVQKEGEIFTLIATLCNVGRSHEVFLEPGNPFGPFKFELNSWHHHGQPLRNMRVLFLPDDVLTETKLALERYSDAPGFRRRMADPGIFTDPLTLSLGREQDDRKAGDQGTQTQTDGSSYSPAFFASETNRSNGHTAAAASASHSVSRGPH